MHWGIRVFSRITRSASWSSPSDVQRMDWR
jgi:hypothetical protein